MIVAALALSLALPAIASEQAASPKPAAPAGQAASQASSPPAPTETYSYQPEGRRDPFLNLLGTGETPATSRRGDGIGAMVTAEVSVRGVMQNGPTLVALVTGPDKKTYIVKAGDKLLDGTIKSVTQQGLVIVQNVNDPLSLEKTREVRKQLRSLEDTK
jgi:type IV pilus assembly protein PilP